MKINIFFCTHCVYINENNKLNYYRCSIYNDGIYSSIRLIEPKTNFSFDSYAWNSVCTLYKYRIDDFENKIILSSGICNLTPEISYIMLMKYVKLKCLV